ncbi:MAG: patatin-like phospholipase family protein [Burkholderiales bacterium]
MSLTTLQRLAVQFARGGALLALLFLAGCSTLLRNPVPPELAPQAVIPGMPDVRAWAGRPSQAMEDDFALSFAQESVADFPVGPDGFVHYAHLALSGGGANGAFGAGLLNGWTKTGSRPVFKIVTGVSTGALMAPFAFLGPGYDAALREFYTTTSSSDIFIVGSMVRIAARALTSDALADSSPLVALIEQHVDAALVQRVADAHRNGRRLYIGTVDLDSLRFVVWNMGLIAASGRPEAVALFRQVMLASASIPVVFPPVFFDVSAGGRQYDEMHVDGAVAARVFYSEGLFRPAALREGRRREVREAREDIYIVHNGQLLRELAPTRRTVSNIALRVLDATGRAGIIGDLFRIHAVARNSNAGFRWVTIPEDVNITPEEVFDPVAMRALYDVGFALAQRPDVWRTRPPGALTD